MTPTPAQPRTPDRDSPEWKAIRERLETIKTLRLADQCDTWADLLYEQRASLQAAVRAAVAEPSGKADACEGWPDSYTRADVLSQLNGVVGAFTGRPDRSRHIGDCLVLLGHEAEIARAGRFGSASRVPAQPEGEKASEMKAVEKCPVADCCDEKGHPGPHHNRAGWPFSDASDSPAPQPEAATGRHARLGELLIQARRLGGLGEARNVDIERRVYKAAVAVAEDVNAGAYDPPPPPPTVETADGWRSKCDVHRAGTETEWSVSSNDNDTHRLIPSGRWITSGEWIGWPPAESYFPSERAARAALAKAPPPPGAEPARTTVTIDRDTARVCLTIIRGGGRGCTYTNETINCAGDILAAALKGTP